MDAKLEHLLSSVQRVCLLMWVTSEAGQSIRKYTANSLSEVCKGLVEDAVAILVYDEILTAAQRGLVVELSNVNLHKIDDSQSILNNALQGLTSMPVELSIHDKSRITEELAMDVINKLKTCENIEMALPEIRLLEKICNLAARIAFKEGAPLSYRMDTLIRDLEHADEKQVIEQFMVDIKKGRYHF